MRKDGRAYDQMRAVCIVPNVLSQAEGSAEVSFGKTRIICTASVEPVVPKWIRTPNMGWVSAEYGMLPRSTGVRIPRNRTTASGRAQEISRLIGRSLRAGVSLKKLGERQVQVDCDVIEADGGSRTAAVTGGFVALALSLQSLKKEVMIRELPLKHYVCAVSAGILRGKVLMDLCYEEDQRVDSDINLVFSSKGELIEIQGSAERETFTPARLGEVVKGAWTCARGVFKKQAEVIGDFFPLPPLS